MLEIISKLNQLLSYPEKRSFFILVGLMLFEASLEILAVSLVPVYMSLVAYPETFYNYAPEHLKTVIIDLVEDIPYTDLILWASGFIFLFFLFKFVFNLLSVYAKTRFSQNRANKLSNRLFNTYMKAPYQFHLQHNSTELIRNINAECMQLAASIISPLVELFSQTIVFLAILSVLILSVPIDTVVTIFSLLSVAAFIVLTQKKTLADHGKEAQKIRGYALKGLIEGLGGIKEIKLLNRTNYFIEQFSKGFTRLMTIQRYMVVLAQAIPGLVELVSILGLLIVVMILFSQGNPPEAVLPIVAIFTVALARLKGTVSTIMHCYAGVQHNQASLDTVYDEITTLEKHLEAAKANDSELLKLNDTLKLRQIYYRYPNATDDCLKNIHLTIKKGEAIGFVGASGAGKSTLIDVILGVLQPREGLISVDGIDIHSNIEAWYRNVGYVPQMIFLIDGSIKQNIALGLEAHEIDEMVVKMAVMDACLEEFIESLPMGLDTVIGEKGVKLSGGQRQRVAIARAIYGNPEILIMDEGTSALDNTTEHGVIRALEGMKGHRTILMIAHRLSTVANCDRIVFLNEGRIEAIGSYQELVATHDGFRQLANPAHA